MLEAMAMELPIIATQVGSIPELIHNNGFLVDLLQPYQLAKRLFLLIKDPELRARMGRKSRHLARKHDIHAMIRDYGQTIEECMSRSVRETLRMRGRIIFSGGFSDKNATADVRILYPLFDHLVSSGHDVYFVDFQKREDASQRKDRTRVRFRPRDLKRYHRFYPSDPRERPRGLKALLEAINPDLIITEGVLSAGIFKDLKPDVDVILIIHEEPRVGSYPWREPGHGEPRSSRGCNGIPFVMDLSEEEAIVRSDSIAFLRDEIRSMYGNLYPQYSFKMRVPGDPNLLCPLKVGRRPDGIDVLCEIKRSTRPAVLAEMAQKANSIQLKEIRMWHEARRLFLWGNWKSVLEKLEALNQSRIYREDRYRFLWGQTMRGVSLHTSGFGRKAEKELRKVTAGSGDIVGVRSFLRDWRLWQKAYSLHVHRHWEKTAAILEGLLLSRPQALPRLWLSRCHLLLGAAYQRLERQRKARSQMRHLVLQFSDHQRERALAKRALAGEVLPLSLFEFDKSHGKVCFSLKTSCKSSPS
jgi:hypothetical protein